MPTLEGSGSHPWPTWARGWERLQQRPDFSLCVPGLQLPNSILQPGGWACKQLRGGQERICQHVFWKWQVRHRKPQEPGDLLCPHSHQCWVVATHPSPQACRTIRLLLIIQNSHMLETIPFSFILVTCIQFFPNYKNDPCLSEKMQKIHKSPKIYITSELKENQCEFSRKSIKFFKKLHIIL